jgi:hypothetical protein
MNSNEEKDRREFLFDGSFDSWKTLLSDNPLAEPGIILLFFSWGKALESCIAGWHIAIANARTIEDRPAFTAVTHIIPERMGKRNITADLKAAIIDQLTQLGLPREKADAYSRSIKICQMPSHEAYNVIESLDQCEDGAAIAISCAQLYRYDDLAETDDSVTETWSGDTYRIRTKEDILVPHLLKLVREALAVAKRKELYVAIFCEELALIQQELPNDLREDNDLVILTEYVKDETRLYAKKLNDWLKKTIDEGVSQVIEEIEKTIKEPIERATFVAWLLFANRHFNAAWKAIEPHLDRLTTRDVGIVLTVGQIAYAVGENDVAKRFLNVAIENGVESLEEIKSAYHLAGLLSAFEIRALIESRMVSEYPSHPTTLWHLFDQNYRSRHFHKASEIARELKDSFLMCLCDMLNESSLQPDVFFLKAQEMGQLDRAHLLVAQEAEKRNDDPLAKRLTSEIKEPSKFLSQAISIRSRVLGRHLRAGDGPSDEDVCELREIMLYVARHPDDLDARFEVETLIEAGIEEPVSIIMLTAILQECISESMREVTEKGFCFEALHGIAMNQENLEMSEARSLHFLEGFMASMEDSCFLLGQGTLDDSLRPQVTDDLLRSLFSVLQYGLDHISDGDFRTIELFLHAIALCGVELANPSADLVAMRTAIGQIVTAGYPQKARDLAETAIVSFPNLQADKASWRTGQAWACYADSFHRSRNMLAAFSCLCYSFISCDTFVINRDLLNSNYRLAARVLRDLGLKDLALNVINIEEEIVTKTDRDSFQLRQLEEFKLMTEVGYLKKDVGSETLIKYLDKITTFLKDDLNIDPEPLLICEAYLLHLLKAKNMNIPQHIMNDFQKNTKGLRKLPQQVLDSIINEKPNLDALLSAMHLVAASATFRDLSYQMTPCRRLALNAVGHACEKGDIHLFIVSSALLSQPVLSLELQSTIEKNPLNIHMLWFKLIGENETILKDAHALTQKLKTNIERSLSPIADISVEKLKSVIMPDETIMILLQDRDRHLCRALIYKDNFWGPKPLDNEMWLPSKYKDWKKAYPISYGEWEPETTSLASRFSSQEVRRSLIGLSVGELQGIGVLTVVPDAELFGFPFGLSPMGKSLLGEDTAISIVPSATWLITARSQQNDCCGRKAWLGSPFSDDLTLHFLRDRLSATLRDFDFEIVDTDTLPSLSHASIALISSHGSVSRFMRFRAVTDNRRAYYLEEVAQRLEGCGCVVLFICSSGRSDVIGGTAETHGLIAELHKANVRCVIAPVWPLHIYVAEQWLRPFLAHLIEGKSVQIASHLASGEIRRVYDNPCAWANLHVYGDGSWSIARRQSIKNS